MDAELSLEKPEALTFLRRNEIYWVNFRITRHLHGQPESARSGQGVRFFHLCPEPDRSLVIFPGTYDEAGLVGIRLGLILYCYSPLLISAGSY